MKIVLIGFMGAGKTTTGKLLAKKLELEYIDMDSMIIKKSNRSSDREIFDIDGEEIFRKLETDVSEYLKEVKNVVISTGGGVVMNEANIDCLGNNGTVIFLKNSFETSKKRISKKNPPPLFRNENKARELYDLRQQLYKKYSDITVETDNKFPKSVADEIINILN